MGDTVHTSMASRSRVSMLTMIFDCRVSRNSSYNLHFYGPLPVAERSELPRHWGIRGGRRRLSRQATVSLLYLEKDKFLFALSAFTVHWMFSLCTRTISARSEERRRFQVPYGWFEKLPSRDEISRMTSLPFYETFERPTEFGVFTVLELSLWANIIGRGLKRSTIAPPKMHSHVRRFESRPLVPLCHRQRERERERRKERETEKHTHRQGNAGSLVHIPFVSGHL